MGICEHEKAFHILKTQAVISLFAKVYLCNPERNRYNSSIVLIGSAISINSFPFCFSLALLVPVCR